MVETGKQGDFPIQNRQLLLGLLIRFHDKYMVERKKTSLSNQPTLTPVARPQINGLLQEQPPGVFRVRAMEFHSVGR